MKRKEILDDPYNLNTLGDLKKSAMEKYTIEQLKQILIDAKMDYGKAVIDASSEKSKNKTTFALHKRLAGLVVFNYILMPKKVQLTLTGE